MTTKTTGRVWHAGMARQIPSTFRTRDRRFRARIYWRQDNAVRERLCAHEHPSEFEAGLCAAAMAVAANEGPSDPFTPGGIAAILPSRNDRPWRSCNE